MQGEKLMAPKTYLYLGVTIAVLALGTWVWNLYAENQRLQLERGILTQNLAATQDSLNVLADSVAITTSFVRDLTTQIEGDSVDYIALQTKYQIALRKIQARDTAHAVVSDSTIRIDFVGDKSIAHYNGFTLYDTHSQKSSYELSLSFSPIEVGAELFKDGELWKIRTYSITPDIDVKGSAVLDDGTYAALQKYSPPEHRKTIGVGLNYTVNQLFGGMVLNGNDWVVMAGYRINHTPSPRNWFDGAHIGIYRLLF
jgi:hypothetical protein